MGKSEALEEVGVEGRMEYYGASKSGMLVIGLERTGTE